MGRRILLAWRPAFNLNSSFYPQMSPIRADIDRMSDRFERSSGERKECSTSLILL